MALARFDIWNEVDDLLTSTSSPDQLLAFRPSPGAQKRLRWLLESNSNRDLTADEEAELREAVALENFMRRLKVRALAKARP